jgi:hypothetical protein
LLQRLTRAEEIFMFVGDFGYRKAIALTGNIDYLLTLEAIRLVVVRPDLSRFEKNLGLQDKDEQGNFSWLVEQGDLTLPGNYRYQLFDVDSDRQIATSMGQFTVGKSLLRK